MLVIESGKPMYYTHTPDHMMEFVSLRLRTLLGCTPNAKKRLWTDYLSDNPVMHRAWNGRSGQSHPGPRNPRTG